MAPFLQRYRQPAQATDAGNRGLPQFEPELSPAFGKTSIVAPLAPAYNAGAFDPIAKPPVHRKSPAMRRRRKLRFVLGLICLGLPAAAQAVPPQPGIQPNSLEVTSTGRRYRPQRRTVSPYLALVPGGLANLAAIQYFTLVQPEITQIQINKEQGNALQKLGGQNDPGRRGRGGGSMAGPSAGVFHDPPEILQPAGSFPLAASARTDRQEENEGRAAAHQVEATPLDGRGYGGHRITLARLLQSSSSPGVSAPGKSLLVPESMIDVPAAPVDTSGAAAKVCGGTMGVANTAAAHKQRAQRRQRARRRTHDDNRRPARTTARRLAADGKGHLRQTAGDYLRTYAGRNERRQHEGARAEVQVVDRPEPSSAAAIGVLPPANRDFVEVGPAQAFGHALMNAGADREIDCLLLRRTLAEKPVMTALLACS